VATQLATLCTGDYSVVGLSDRVRIERKSLSDFVSCCAQERERFMDECRRLRDFEFRLVIIEAEIANVWAHAYRSAVHPSSVIGTSIAIFTDYAVPVLWAGDASTASAMAERILTRLWRKHVATEAA
jgi:ERCC4-type nuclease